MLVMLGHRAPVTVIIQATVEGEFADLGPTDVIISAAEDGSANASDRVALSHPPDADRAPKVSLTARAWH